MATINGTASWGFQPLDFNSSDLAGAFWLYRGNYLKSANDPLRYQIQWFSGGINEGEEPSAANWDSISSKGDVVNVVFSVIDYTDTTNPITLATIKKSRDIANKRYDTQAPAVGHRFTIDVSQIMSDQLSYSLCPINKGTWQSNEYGGMNGGLIMQDNVIGNSAAAGNPVSNYNVSKNGTFKRLRVKANFEIIKDDGSIISASISNEETSQTITVINSVNQFEKDDLFYVSYTMSDTSSLSSQQSFKFLTRCFNNSNNSSIPFKKPIRIDEEAEFLQFYLRQGGSGDINGTGDDDVGAMGFKVETFDASGAENTFYIRDFEDNLITETDTTLSKKFITNPQQSNCIQNISPSFINNASLYTPTNSGVASFPYWTAYSSDKITANTLYYRVSLWKFGFLSPYTGRRSSQFMYYTIDREDVKIPYGFVRFHWLNSLGGTDSYTAKRDIVEGLTISRDVIERKSSDRTWYQSNQVRNATNDGSTTLDTSLYHSDTMRGGDIYKGGREVTNVNAERTQSVYTEPLNKDVAKWLEEMMLSPNVWIEMDTDATEMGNDRNPYLRPSDKEYIPVIITNSDIETVNQENGLVKFNIEYTLAHKVITQRN